MSATYGMLSDALIVFDLYFENHWSWASNRGKKKAQRKKKSFIKAEGIYFVMKYLFVCKTFETSGVFFFYFPFDGKATFGIWL